MILSLSSDDLKVYVTRQLNHFFPDKQVIKSSDLDKVLDVAIDRVNYCFDKVANERYNKNGQTILNHLYADHYLIFLWFLSNTFWKNSNNTLIATKLYYLNKCLHAFDCMYDTGLPDIFLVFHGAGTMLGKATYSNYFVVLQGCTVGANKGIYPVFENGVAIAANSSVIGNCKISKRSTIGTGTTILDTDTSTDSTTFIDFGTGKLEIKSSKTCYAQQFYNFDLKQL